jgi:hypothetical protein
LPPQWLTIAIFTAVLLFSALQYTNASCSVFEAVVTSGQRDAVAVAAAAAATLAYVHSWVSDWEARLDRSYLQDLRALPLLLILPGAAASSVTSEGKAIAVAVFRTICNIALLGPLSMKVANAKQGLLGSVQWTYVRPKSFQLFAACQGNYK